MKIVLTGGIACGKSLVGRMLREEGVLTLDADDVVHEIIPAEERRRLAPIVFADPAERKKLEERVHPFVRMRLQEFISRPSPPLRVAIVPLLFEVHWEGEYDIICCVSSKRSTQISRMVSDRGYSEAEAEARLNAQLPVEIKASKSHYVIENEGSEEELKRNVVRFVGWLKGKKSDV